MSQRMIILSIVSALAFFIIGWIGSTLASLLHFMVQTLFSELRDTNRIPSSRKVEGRIRSNGAAALLVPMALALLLFVPIQHASAGPQPVPERTDIIMIGDRLVDVAYHLGVVPAAMSLRCSMWPMCKELQTASQVLGCPKCLLKKKAQPLLTYAEKQGLKRVIIEKSDPYCLYMPDLKLQQIEKLLEGKGFVIQYVDFSKGLEPAIQQTAALLGKEDKASAVITNYTKAMEKTLSKIKAPHQKKVVILNGIYQPSSGKITLRVEAPGGYADRFLLEKLGCVNVGDTFKPANGKTQKGHYPVKKKKGGMVLDPLIDADPDVIVMTGDAFAVQKALADHVAANPKLAQVKAVRNMAVFALPGYVDAGVLAYPAVLGKWANALLKSE